MKTMLCLLIVFLCCSVASAGGPDRQVTVTYGTSSLFVGIMAALWASRTGRSGVKWFFFGWILAPICCLVAWLKNNGDYSSPKFPPQN
ncbi:MAG: hypothetical protein PHQ23_13710 [Candidatus Wallbacteria bacterium]|nr:hypothetical protein [Candidatus Wallbacteria bacterium]